MSKEKCGAILKVSDDFGDNETTIRCQLDEGHPGQHKNTFRNGTCTIVWVGDNRYTCDRCGKKMEEYFACHGLNDNCPTRGKKFCEQCADKIRPGADKVFWKCSDECDQRNWY